MSVFGDDAIAVVNPGSSGLVSWNWDQSSDAVLLVKFEEPRPVGLSGGASHNSKPTEKSYVPRAEVSKSDMKGDRGESIRKSVAVTKVLLSGLKSPVVSGTLPRLGDDGGRELVTLA